MNQEIGAQFDNMAPRAEENGRPNREETTKRSNSLQDETRAGGKMTTPFSNSNSAGARAYMLSI